MFLGRIGREHRRIAKDLDQLITDALETICRIMSAPVTPEQASLRGLNFRKEGNELVCRHFWDPYQSTEKVGTTRFTIDEKTASRVVVSKCVLDNATRRTGVVQTDEAGGSTVGRIPKDFKGVKGSIKPTLRYVLAAPIRNEDGTIWGVVDSGASNALGKELTGKGGGIERDHDSPGQASFNHPRGPRLAPWAKPVTAHRRARPGYALLWCPRGGRVRRSLPGFRVEARGVSFPDEPIRKEAAAPIAVHDEHDALQQDFP